MKALEHFVAARIAADLQSIYNCRRCLHAALETRYADAIDEPRNDLQSDLGDIEPNIDVFVVAFGVILCDTRHIEHTRQLSLEYFERWRTRWEWELEWEE